MPAALNDPEYRVAESARDFYKNGPSFLNRYLPFWMTNYAQRILTVLAMVIAIVLSLFNYVPKLYLWFVREYTNNLMRRLRVIENGLQTELGAAQVQTFQSELENIGRAANLLPMRHTDLFFSLRGHIDRERARLASRLVEGQSQTAKAT